MTNFGHEVSKCRQLMSDDNQLQPVFVPQSRQV
jgi:hypothetical protein